MADYLNLEIDAAATLISGLFIYIFPEYPKIGLYVAGLSFVLFLFYWLKSGALHGAKISAMITIGIVFLLASFHYLGKLFYH